MTKEKTKWKMPDWMEPYRDSFSNTGGNTVEELMNNTTASGGNNVVLSALIVAVESQVILLSRLHAKGQLGQR